MSGRKKVKPAAAGCKAHPRAWMTAVVVHGNYGAILGRLSPILWLSSASAETLDAGRVTMVSIKPKTIVTMNLQGTCPTHARTDVLVRDVETTIDEPEERGGTNLGPSPTETMLAALIGCTNVITHKIAAKNGIQIDALSVDVEATLDRRGVTLAEEIEVPFPEIKLLVNVTTGADDADIEKLKTDLAKYCPVSKVIRRSGSKLIETWTITRP